MLELIRRCKYCKSEMMHVSPRSWRENPYCQDCLEERVEKASKENQNKDWKIQGNYLVLTQALEKPSLDA